MQQSRGETQHASSQNYEYFSVAEGYIGDGGGKTQCRRDQAMKKLYIL